VHDLAATLRSKGIAFPEQCRVFEVCNPQQAAQVLAADMALNMALPCRISVYTESGKTHIGMIRPEAMLSSLSSDPGLADVAHQVEVSTMAIITDATAERERVNIVECRRERFWTGIRVSQSTAANPTRTVRTSGADLEVKNDPNAVTSDRTSSITSVSWSGTCMGQPPKWASIDAPPLKKICPCNN
jgi:hypothetical protein